MSDQPAPKRVNLVLDDVTQRQLFVLGQGNVSAGARLAAQFSYDQYQRGRLALPRKPAQPKRLGDQR